VGSNKNSFQTAWNCEVVLEVISSKWALPVICTIQQDTLRYSTIEKGISGITQRALTLALKKLERNGMLERTMYSTIPPQVEYKLTRLGLELLKFCEVMNEWSDKHEAEIKYAQKAYDRSNKS